MNTIKTYVFVLFSLFIFQLSNGQTPPFYQAIENFKAEDARHSPPTRPILLIGSSSFTKWTDVSAYFPGKTILNRGFGGSTLPDLIRYFQDIVVPYKPRQIVIYCGDNDISAGASAQMVLDRYKILESLIRYHLGDVPIAYVSIKPSVARKHLMAEMSEANHLIRDYIANRNNRDVFIDVYHPMLDDQGNPSAEIFLKDQLHMNEKGYAIWKKAIGPHLL